MSLESAVTPRCRFCHAGLTESFVNLGSTPLCQSHITPAQLGDREIFYPLHARVCERCFLVQLEDYVAPPQMFSEYAYFSSYVDALVDNARDHYECMLSRFAITGDSLVVEIGSNDGYLLQHYAAAGIPVLGIEPAANVAAVAQGRGIPTEVCYHGRATARRIAGEHGKADLLIGNNVLAHTPDLNGFVAGLRHLLKPDGVVTMEFPHLSRLMEQHQFDTIYHEHYSYFSLRTVQRVFSLQQLELFDVEELPIHGGSLRIYAAHVGRQRPTERLQALLAREQGDGLEQLQTYRDFGRSVEKIKRDILALLIGLKNEGHQIVGYGAPGKATTLLNYCGLRTDFLDYTVDCNPYKQGNYTPGTRIPICAPARIAETRPDFVLILPWNLREEITSQMSHVRDWGGRFIVPIPEPCILA